ncbi:hypothetical protein [Leisingera sp. M523]|uniref:hypothetical protein n=1 Tax=Leisingera sp. M523 TaxID=2867013 RepID=UPI0021A7133C|nr:hypothetical protein [Leisingera sp. M523]UWQ30017.1 hypothetical protein K3557_05580 [Leisingera sp. M523]
MSSEMIVSTAVSRVAALGGFLDGLSFLNKDQRANFAAAFVVNAAEDKEVLSEICSAFSQLPPLRLSLDQSFDGGFAQLEKDIGSFLLIDPHVSDEQKAKEMRSYLAFKVMGRLDEIAELKDFAEPKRIISATDAAMIFYLLRTRDVSFVMYFCCSAGTPLDAPDQ